MATDLRVLSNVDFASNATSIPLRDDSVDTVIALELLEHVTDPGAVLRELARVLKPGGTVIVSVPSAVPRHDDHDYWRFTAEGLGQLGTEVFGGGDVHVFGGTFEALGYLLSYYIALVFHVVGAAEPTVPGDLPVGGPLARSAQRLVLVEDRAPHPGLRPAVHRHHRAGRRTEAGFRTGSAA